MAQIVAEIMNRELFSLRPHDTVDAALRRISGAPVLDDQGRPIGMISFRDLLARKGGDSIAERMSSPAVSVRPDTPIRDAARLLADRSFHRLVVVDDSGHAIGMLGVFDVMRALIGMPVSHPDTFPHFDYPTGVAWSDDALLDLQHLNQVPDEPGILKLRVGGADGPETDVWVEPTANLRERVRAILTLPQADRRLMHLLERYGARLRYRAAAVSGQRREHALQALHDREDAWVWSRSS